MADAIRLLSVRSSALSVDEVVGAVADDSAGGTVVFIGTVRNVDDSRAVAELGYEAHSSVETVLRAIAEKIVADFPVRGLAAVHRIGDLAIGDVAVVVAVSCPHRGEAFDACRRLIDDLKATVPIWKRQRFTDGSEEWVGSP